MKEKILVILILLILWTNVSVALANTNGELDLSISPVGFDLDTTNLKPGETLSKEITIKNEGIHDLFYSALVSKGIGSDKFYHQLELEVSRDIEILNKGNLHEVANFKKRSLLKGESENFKVKVIFPYESGNE